MPRYIKDGAYTIVIDDGPVNNGKKGSSTGQKSDGEGSRNNEDIEEDMINFSSPSFMLQNLSIAQPTFESDKSSILNARKEVAEIISTQICYYIYLGLQPYVFRSDPPTILLLGDGYIGTNVAFKLADHGCTPYIRIFSRSEFNAKEWRKRGFTASASLSHLMRQQKLNIIVLCSDYSSIYMIYHQLTELKLLSQDCFLINCTVGILRKRLYYNFSTPNVFRCYVEPQTILKKLKSDSSNFFGKHSDLFDTSEMMAETESGLDRLEEANRDGKEDNCSDEEDDSSKSSSDDENLVNSIQKAAQFMVTRVPSIIRFIHLVENYYVMNDLTPTDARRLALRCVVGYIENSTRISPNRGRQTSPKRREFSPLKRKLGATVKEIEKILVSIYMEIGKSFHRAFSKIIKMSELISLAEQEFVLHSPRDFHDAEEDEENDRKLVQSTSSTQIIIKLRRGTKAIYERAYFNTIFLDDEDVSALVGSGYEYMQHLNLFDERKKTVQASNR
jgi:hypothetical protein